MNKVKINEITDNPSINIAIDTVEKEKQAIVFCNTRRSSEATSEKISGKLKLKTDELKKIANDILKVLSKPTKQCRRLALCIRGGTAFHHAGLASKQRQIIEDNFRNGTIKIICSTPTLALGVNMPAFRTIIKDLKRYGGRWGMKWIPTLEYHQMAGRAGRPDFNDEHGEAICIAKKESDKEEILEKYVNAPPENILSKLAVEPVLRTYCLSLLATDFAKTKAELTSFFEETFYGHQYGDMAKLDQIIVKILDYLEEWEFIKYQGASDFVSASDIDSDKIEVTKLGERVAQLYIDPYTAHKIITALRRATQKITNEISFVQLACSTLELRPLSTVRTGEIDEVEAELSEISSDFITFEPSVFDPDYDEFLKSVKLTLALRDWMDEKDEDFILINYSIRPGELHYKRDLCDWILYSSEELAKLLAFREQITMIRKTRFRLDKGIKEELVPLARIKNIGRVRARKLYRNGIKNVRDIKKTSITKLTQLLGPKTAKNLKKQVGQKIEKVPKGKRKGQTNIEKY